MIFSSAKFWLVICLCALIVLLILSNLRTTLTGWNPNPVILPTQQPVEIASPPVQVVLPKKNENKQQDIGSPYHYILSSTDCTPSSTGLGKSQTGNVDITPRLPPGFKPSKSVNRPDDSKDSEGEREARRVLEQIFGCRFDKMRPEDAFDGFVNDRTGYRMELDGISVEAGKRYGYSAIAFEYQGNFHYQSDHFFYHGDYKKFLETVYKDELKLRLCDKYGIYLFTIPYHVKKKDIYRYILYYLPENVLARSRQQV